MRKIIMCTLLALFMCSCSQDKELIAPGIPQQNTLPLSKTTLSLNYLQRDTLDFPGYIDDSRVVLKAIDGDTCVTIIGNVVVGRRKGNATILAKYEDMSSIISVNVQTEEYIPIENLICNINGDEYKSDSLPSWQCCQLLNIKLKEVKPANATVQEVNDIEINSYDENGKLWWKAEDVSANIHGFTSLQKSGNIKDIDSISLRVFPRTGFMVNDSPCFMLAIDLNVWPKDLVMSDWDKHQLIRVYGDSDKKTIRKLFVFVAKENAVSINKDVDSDGQKEHIFIRTGETKQLSATLTYPGEFSCQDNIVWNMDVSHNQYMNQNNLRLTDKGELYLSSTYCGENYPYYNGLQKDTVYIGYVRASVLKEGSEIYSKVIDQYQCAENTGGMCYMNAKHWIRKLQKEERVDVYWVR